MFNFTFIILAIFFYLAVEIIMSSTICVEMDFEPVDDLRCHCLAQKYKEKAVEDIKQNDEHRTRVKCLQRSIECLMLELQEAKLKTEISKTKASLNEAGTQTENI